MARHRFNPDLPPLWALAFIAFSWVAASAWPIWSFDSQWWTAAAVVLVTTGLALMIWAALWFRQKATSIEPRRTPGTLIVEGPFRINRNPIYTGMTLVVIGVAIWMGALSAILISLAFPWVITGRFIRQEEAVLRRSFGAQAEAYFQNTRRW